MNAPLWMSRDIEYPDSDGQPMAENTLQYEWIVTIQGNLDALFRDRPDVFVAGDNLIYPVEGRPDVRMAPDVYVAFGRPKGHRGSYRVWKEEGVFPQVVFEVLSPGNRAGEMRRKRLFYRDFGAEEYYVFDPDDNTLEAWVRRDGQWAELNELDGWASPRLGVTFDLSGDRLVIRYPDGRPFLTMVELASDRDAAMERAEAEKQRADDAERRAAALAERLRQLGVNPEEM